MVSAVTARNECTPLFPKHLPNTAKLLDVLRNRADKEQSLERNKRMSNKEQQTKTLFISVWYKCVTMSGWEQQPCFIYKKNSRSIKNCNFDPWMHHMQVSAGAMLFLLHVDFKDDICNVLVREVTFFIGLQRRKSKSLICQLEKMCDFCYCNQKISFNNQLDLQDPILVPYCMLFQCKTLWPFESIWMFCEISCFSTCPWQCFSVLLKCLHITGKHFVTAKTTKTPTSCLTYSHNL